MSGELPPLPPQRVINRHLPTGVALHGYNADDMRAYAAAAVAAENARLVLAVEVLRQIAAAPRKTREQRLASSCLALLGDEQVRRGGLSAVLERAGAPKDRRKQATPERTKRMESALKVLSTWAEFPPLDAREVRELCFRALKADEDA